MGQLVRLEGKHSTQNAHCALYRLHCEEKKDIAYGHRVMFEITESTQHSLSQAMEGLAKHLSSIY